MRIKKLVEQHFHGAYGVDFNTATYEQIQFLRRKIFEEGVGYIFPTLVTDSIDNIKKQISLIAKCSTDNSDTMAKIVGVHLEGIFLNPAKKGIHDESLFLEPAIEYFKLIEHPIIKIVTLAPELCNKDNSLIDYLRVKGIKVQAGHCLGGDLSGIDATTHTFNAMSGITHRGKSTSLTALISDNIYTEIIADGVHVSDDALKLLFKTKPADKILLISDCLPCTHSGLKEFEFAGSKIYFDGKNAMSKEGTLAGSSLLLPDIVKLLIKKDMFKTQYIDNSYSYHNLPDIGTFEIEESTVEK